MDFSKKEIIIKKTWGKILFESVVGSLIGSYILYYLTGPMGKLLGQVITDLNDEGLALNVALYMFPIILIIILLINIGVSLLSQDKSQPKKKNVISKKKGKK